VESAELIALLHEVRDRVRARNPETAAGGVEIALPDLMPLAHARDAALGKVAAIGTVNPRPGGVVNSLVQAWKRMISRVLDWHVREQVEFNRKSMACIDAALEAMADFNRALVAMGNRMAAQEKVGEELKDIRNHWAEWRFEWERKLQQNEMQFLRSVADLQGGFQHRATLMDANYRDAMRGQHAEFTGALERFSLDIQKRLWADLERIRLDYERLGRTAFDPENFATRDPVNLLNLRGGVTAVAGWELSLWARNLTNRDYLSEMLNPNGIAWLARPRQWGGDVTRRF